MSDPGRIPLVLFVYALRGIEVLAIAKKPIDSNNAGVILSPGVQQFDTSWSRESGGRDNGDRSQQDHGGASSDLQL